MQAHRVAKRRKKDFAKNCRARYVKHLCRHIQEHMDHGDMGGFHQTLRKIGVRNVDYAA